MPKPPTSPGLRQVAGTGFTFPALRGLMTWSINWDRYYGWEFMNNHEPYLNSLP
jgi:chitinase